MFKVGDKVKRDSGSYCGMERGHSDVVVGIDHGLFSQTLTLATYGEGHDSKNFALVKDASPLSQQTGGQHYKGMKIQPVEFIHANGLGFMEGNVVKYIARWQLKNGLEDLEKAKHYIELLIELEKNKK
ncbi:nucelotide kinase [Stenotrophomonas phage StenR_269]|nr:nucelotide kinase [Stenotrophomonas phage StenR_269]